MQSLSKFSPGLAAPKVDFQLKSALEIEDRAHQCSLDWFGEILNRKLFRELGYGSINQYAKTESAKVQTSKGELEIGEQEFEQLQCDCQISRTGQRNKISIPPSVRREVFAKARHKCETPGCGHNRFLEIHHIVPRNEGGSNELSIQAAGSTVNKMNIPDGNK